MSDQRRRAAVTALLLTAFLVLSACEEGATAGRPNPSASPSSTASTEDLVPGAELLKDVQASAADLGVVEVSGGTSGSAVVGRREGIVNMESGEFRASLQLGKGGVLEMMRSSDLTWSKAPASYWVSLGYTRGSANAARGKWVVALADQAKLLLDSMDPGAVIRSILRLEASEVTAVRTLAEGSLKGSRVLVFEQNGSVQKLYVRGSGDPVLQRLTSTSAGVTTTVNFDTSPRSFRVRLPRPEDVVQP